MLLYKERAVSQNSIVFLIHKMWEEVAIHVVLTRLEPSTGAGERKKKTLCAAISQSKGANCLASNVSAQHSQVMKLPSMAGPLEPALRDTSSGSAC